MSDLNVTGIRFLNSVKSIITELPENPNQGDRHLARTRKQMNYVIEYVDGEWVRDNLYPMSGVVVEEEKAAYTYSKNSSHKFRWFKSVTVDSLAKIYGRPHNLIQMQDVIAMSKGLYVEDGRLQLKLSEGNCLSFDNPDSQEASLRIKVDEDQLSIEDGVLGLRKDYYTSAEVDTLLKRTKLQSIELIAKMNELLKSQMENIEMMEQEFNNKLNQVLTGDKFLDMAFVIEEPTDWLSIDTDLYIRKIQSSKNFNHATVNNIISIYIDDCLLEYHKEPGLADYTIGPGMVDGEKVRINFTDMLPVAARIRIRALTNTY